MQRRTPRPAFTLTEVLLVLGILAILAALLFPAIQRARAATGRVECAQHLRQLGIALHHYHDIHGSFPPSCCIGGPWPAERGLGWYNPPFGAPPNPYLNYRYGQQFFSFLARILPELEQDSLYARIDWNAWPWFQGPAGDYLNAVPLKVFQCPADPHAGMTWTSTGWANGTAMQAAESLGHPGTSRLYAASLTNYLAVNGTNQLRFDGILHVNGRVRLTDVSDGTSNTLMVGERPVPRDLLWGWWLAEIGEWPWFGAPDMSLGVEEIDFNDPPQTEYVPHDSYRPGDLDDPNYWGRWHHWSLHPAGAHWLLGDGSVQFFPYSIDKAILAAMATRCGGEVVSPE
jgi:prepilin-type N-terminal cleavage/methylation domain-containing protein